ncbi:MAG: hypothetical protein WAR22_07995 [Desulfomonilia bacterium]
MTNDRIEGAANIAKYLGWSLTKFNVYRNNMRKGRAIYKDKFGKTKRWCAFKNKLQDWVSENMKD